MPNIRDCLTEAERICWDESIGYTWGGWTDAMGYDCARFVWRCLYAAGFPVASTPFAGTSAMETYLPSIGFQMLNPADPNFTPKDGDIFEYTDYDPQGQATAGHTFFYFENVIGYVNGQDWRTCDSTTGLLTSARVEASGIHNHPEPGDQDNGHGAHTEVWIHAYNSLGPAYRVYRWPSDDDEIETLAALLYKILL